MKCGGGVGVQKEDKQKDARGGDQRHGNTLGSEGATKPRWSRAPASVEYLIIDN